jgi:type II secretory ATPase GspE/PulE/Tfp pilus assembly ATPase PilB-like protein
MLSPQEEEKKLFGALLVESGLISLTQLASALEEQKKSGGRLGFTLVQLGLITPADLVAFLQDHLGVGILQDTASERQKAAEALPRHLAFYYKIAPIRLSGGVLTVAIAEIAHPNLMRVLSEVTGYTIDPLIYPEKQIRQMVDASYRLPTQRGVEMLTFGENLFTILDSSRGIKPFTPLQLKDETDAGEWLRAVIAEAIKEKSREILIKPESAGASVSFKRDNFFASDFVLDMKRFDDLTFLLFGLSRLDPLQQQKPQHGRFLVRVNDRKVLMVASAFPTIYGMRFVLEMFDERMLRRSYEEITNPFPELRRHLQEFVNTRKGMCIVTGPEGAGRTQFLYSVLSRFKDQFQQVMTLENFVRYPISGLSQTQVADENMEAALENVFGQKPDLLAVHSLKTVRAVEVAFLIAARLPVFAVLPCYDAYVAVEWLARHNLKSAVKAGLLHSIISPRLLPLVCPGCSSAYILSEDERKAFELPEDADLRMNGGCESCRNAHEGNAEPAFEVLRIDPEFLGWFEASQGATVLRQRARDAGRRVLFDVALQQASGGNLDVLSVLKLQSAL